MYKRNIAFEFLLETLSSGNQISNYIHTSTHRNVYVVTDLICNVRQQVDETKSDNLAYFLKTI